MKKILTCLFVLAAGCDADPGVPRFPINLLELTYEFRSELDGVFPSDSILLDDNNPFVELGMSQDLAFAITGVEHGPATYYAWGTLLALGGSDPGVAQYFTGVGLQLTLETGQFTEKTNSEDVRLQAIAAYQAMLDNQPATLLDTDGRGTVVSRLATLAYLAIAEDLGGTVQGNWELIEYVNEDGDVIQVAVQGGAQPVLPPEFAPAEEDDPAEGSEQ